MYIRKTYITRWDTNGDGYLDEEEMANMIAHRDVNHYKCVIRPTDPFVHYWDPYILLLLVFTAIVTPMEVGFMGDRTWDNVDFLFVVNRFVDVSFIVDMVLQFFMARPSSVHSPAIYVCYTASTRPAPSDSPDPPTLLLQAYFDKDAQSDVASAVNRRSSSPP